MVLPCRRCRRRECGCGRSGWTCTVMSVRSRSPRTARCVPRVGSRRVRRCWSASRRAWPRTTGWRWRSPGPRGRSSRTSRAWSWSRRVTPGIRQARAKADRLDARTLARLLAAGSLDSVWTPDERTRVMRRRLARRAQLVAARTRVKNEIHAILIRRLKGRPDASDLFGKKGRAWLGELELPLEERETLESGLRQIDFLAGEIALVERAIAHDALNWPDARRLMTVPGVNVIVAVTFLAAIGDIRRFPDRRKLVAYLGLDPKVRQSGNAPASHGHISKQGSAPARHALVE